MIHLHRTAPWNSSLRPQYRVWYAEVDGRYFKVQSDPGRTVLWSVYEIDAEDDIIKQAADGFDNSFVAIAFNLPQVRLAIQMRIDGKSEDEIRRAVIAAPSAGTGRNHPRNVAARKAWRQR